jgi:hypothetical protein
MEEEKKEDAPLVDSVLPSLLPAPSQVKLEEEKFEYIDNTKEKALKN